MVIIIIHNTISELAYLVWWTMLAARWRRDTDIQLGYFRQGNAHKCCGMCIILVVAYQILRKKKLQKVEWPTWTSPIQSSYLQSI